MLCPLRRQERSPAGAWGQAAASHEGTPGQPALGIVGAEPRAGSQPCSQCRSHLPLLASLAPKRSQGLNASWWAASSCSPASFGTPKRPVDIGVCRVLAMQHPCASPGSSMAPERQQAQTRPAWFFLGPFEMSLRSWCPFLFPQGTPGIPPAPGAAPRRCPGTAIPEHRRVPVAPQGPHGTAGSPEQHWDPKTPLGPHGRAPCGFGCWTILVHQLSPSPLAVFARLLPEARAPCWFRHRRGADAGAAPEHPPALP